MDNDIILNNRMTKYNQIAGPRVGDWIVAGMMFPLESYLTKKERIDHIKQGQGHNLNRLQAAIFQCYGIESISFN